MMTTKSNFSSRAQIVFWRTVSQLTRFALRHKRGLYNALTVAPIAIIALAAFIVGRGVGLLIGTGLF